MIGLLFAGLAVAAFIRPAYAADCGGVDTNVIDCGSANDTTGSPVVAILVVAIQILTALVGVVAIGAFVYAGIMYASASNNTAQISKAKEIIRNTVIGLVVFSGMALLLNWLIPGGLFTGTAKFGAGGDTAPHLAIDDEDDIGAGVIDSEVDPGGKISVRNNTCYWNYAAAKPTGEFFHIDNTKDATKTNSYAFENSPEGVKYASSHGYKRIDIDIQTTKDGVIVATHSKNPFMTKGNGTWGGFYDPSGKITKGTIQELTFAQVSKLRHKVGGYKIHRLEDIIAAAKQTNMILNFELKTPKTLQAKIPSIAIMVNQAHIRASFMGLVNKPGQSSALKVARQHGFWAEYLYETTNGAPIKTTGCGK